MFFLILLLLFEFFLHFFNSVSDFVLFSICFHDAFVFYFMSFSCFYVLSLLSTCCIFDMFSI